MNNLSKTLALATVAGISAISSPAFAGSVDDFAGQGWRRSGGTSSTTSTLETNRVYTENGSFEGQQSQTNFDVIMPRSGDLKFNDNGVWAHEGVSKFSLQESASSTQFDFSEKIEQQGTSHTISNEWFNNSSDGYIIDANIRY